MKKTLLAVMLIALVASLSYGQEVLSRNAVGYVKGGVPKDGLALVVVDFEAMDGDLSIDSVIGAQLPDNSSVYLWDPVGQGYVIRTKARGAWASGTQQFERGYAFFLKGANDADPSTNFPVYFMGEVPDGTTGPTTTVSMAGAANLNAVGYGYPVSIAFSNTTLPGSLSDNSTVIFFDTASQSYTFYTKSRGVFPPAAQGKIIEPGEGFWVQPAIGDASFDWDEAKPYTWPE